jgi:small nuclear ribonucleoprotein E
MNVVIDEAAEVYVKDAKPRRELGEIPYFNAFNGRTPDMTSGRILLKGDNITLIQQVV